MPFASEVIAMLLAGGILYLAVSWLTALLAADQQAEMLVSSDELLAFAQTEELEEEFAAESLPDRLPRQEIFRRVNWVWKSSRVLALNSGSWLATIGLAVLWLASVLLSLKTLIWPSVHDLRILLGGKEFIYYLVAARRRF